MSFVQISISNGRGWHFLKKVITCFGHSLSPRRASDIILLHSVSGNVLSFFSMRLRKFMVDDAASHAQRYLDCDMHGAQVLFFARVIF